MQIVLFSETKKTSEAKNVPEMIILFSLDHGLIVLVNAHEKLIAFLKPKRPATSVTWFVRELLFTYTQFVSRSEAAVTFHNFYQFN